MGGIIPNGFGNCVFHFRLQGQDHDQVVTLGYTAPTTDPPDAHATTLSGLWTNTTNGPFAASQFTSLYTYLGCTVTEEHGAGPVVANFNTNLVGTVSATATLVPNWALLVKKSTTIGGRIGRGRMYIPAGFVVEGNVDALGSVGATVTNALQPRFTTTLQGMVSNGLAPVLLHSKVGIPPSSITSFSVQTLGATQRRRMR